MKKVLALVLAVMMLATIAMAADATNPGDGTTSTSSNVLPGGKIKIGQKGVIDSLAPGSNLAGSDIKAINSTNYSITGIKYREGKNLVESITLNDTDDQVVIKLKQDYSMTTAKKLDLDFTLKGKKVGKNPRNKDIDITINKTMVAYTLADGKNNVGYIQIDANGDVRIVPAQTVVNSPVGTYVNDFAASKADEFVWKVKKTGTTAYGDMEFTAADGDTDVSVRVYDGDKLYLYSDVDADTDVLKAYADADADITFLNFPGNPTFNSTATVYFYKEEGTYVYGVKDGKLVNVNAKWSDDESGFVLKTRTLGSYVFSDKKLSVSAPAAGSENPDTGANDVVGIATALAAVALVSAAAVSLKK